MLPRKGPSIICLLQQKGRTNCVPISDSMWWKARLCLWPVDAQRQLRNKAFDLTRTDPDLGSLLATHYIERIRGRLTQYRALFNRHSARPVWRLLHHAYTHIPRVCVHVGYTAAAVRITRQAPRAHGYLHVTSKSTLSIGAPHVPIVATGSVK
eukprot:TRINITY_DN27931_c0_g1_i1.p1 TRINITY_DN27931_c0_g1~~TRINITY_DN27931_c0_g1_i1.p1  ORF type:complete len:163 (-),score=10.42 TRINITY_DN27931_c0_g1_i1:242-700(-)